METRAGIRRRRASVSGDGRFVGRMSEGSEASETNLANIDPSRGVGSQGNVDVGRGNVDVGRGNVEEGHYVVDMSRESDRMRFEPSPTATFNPIPGVKSLKLELAKYDGKREASTVSTFLIGLEDILELGGLDLCSPERSTQNNAIRLSRYYLAGQAQQWFDEVRRDLTTFEEFKTELRAEFIPATELEKVGQAFYKAMQTQNGRTRAVGEFATDLKRLRNLMPEDAISLYTLNQRFLDGMDADLRAKVRPLFNLQGAFRENQKLAERYDSALHEERQESRRKGAIGGPRAIAPQVIARTVSTTRAPASTPQGSALQGGRLSEAEKEHRKRNGLCYYCGQAGHTANFHARRGAHGGVGQRTQSRPEPRVSRMKLEMVEQNSKVEQNRKAATVVKGFSYADAVKGMSSRPGAHPAAAVVKSDNEPAPLHHEAPRYKIKISGQDAIVGMDTECTTVLLNTKFAHLHNLPFTRCEHTLQLGVQGSKGQIRGMHRGEMKVNGMSLGMAEFGIANLPDVDAYIGQPILKRWGAVMDCDSRDIQLKRPQVILKENKFYALSAMTFGSSVEEMKGSADELGEIHEPLKEKLTEGEWFNKKRKELLEEFDDVLVDKIPKDWLPPLRPGMDHEIPLIDGECKYPSRPLRLPRVYEREVRQHWEDMVKLGTAIPAPQDKQSSPLFTVAKKEPGRFREVYDLRARNANTKKQQIMLPHREEIIAKLAGARYISKFDLPDCFLQFRVRPEDVKHTTVATPFGQFRMKLMQMGDTNAPATCQRAMWVIAEGLQGKGLLVFVDDGWLVTTGSREEHLDLIKEVLRRFRKYRFLLSTTKSGFFMDQVNVLGEIRNNAEGYRVPEGKKIEAIVNYPTPRNASEVSTFLGMFNFVTGYGGTQGSLIGSNVTPLGAHQKRSGGKEAPKVHTHPDLGEFLDDRGKFKWTPRHQRAFEKMKEILTSHPYLQDVEVDESMVDTYVLIDSCLVGTGGCAAQARKGQPWYTAKPTRYFSKAFNTAQKNYAVHEQETLGLYLFLKDNEIEMRGRKIYVLTDNDCLMRLKARPMDQMSSREIRMLEFLNEFDLEIRHIPGTTNVVADAISRIGSNAKYGNKKMYSRGRQVERCEEEEVLKVSAVKLESTSQEDMVDVIRRNLKNDGFTVKIMEKLGSHREFYMKDDLLWFEDQGNSTTRLVVPRSAMLEGKPVAHWIIKSVHESMAHLGVRTTLPQVRNEYYWPALQKDVSRYCRECSDCQHAKSATQKKEPPRHFLEVPAATDIFKHLAIDFVGPLPEVEHVTYKTKVNAIMVVIDRLTSYAICLPCRTDMTAEGTARMLFEYVYPYHGLPDSIVSDRDPRFNSEVWRDLCAMMGIDLRMSTAFHPRTDGQVERTNRVIGDLLRAELKGRESEWARKLGQVTWALNSRLLSTCKKSPHHLVYGSIARSPRIATAEKDDLSRERDWDAMEIWRNELRADAREDMLSTRIMQTVKANEKSGEEPEFQVGDMVLLDAKDIQIGGVTRKLQPKWIGPFKISSIYKEYSTYKLELPKRYKIHNVFHASKLRKAKGDLADFWNEPEEVRDNTEYVVEEVKDRRKRSGRAEVLVKWLGYDELTWEPLRNLSRTTAYSKFLEDRGQLRGG